MSKANDKLHIDKGGGTVGHIVAHGEFATRKAAIWALSILAGILIIGGLIAFLKDPDKSKDLWVIIGPLISACITGLVAFWSRRDTGSSNS